ncbi:MAG: hypothetical protein OHK0046_46230 [Anaerolineae bacterium]
MPWSSWIGVPRSAFDEVSQKGWGWKEFLPDSGNGSILVVPNILKTQLAGKENWSDMDFLGGGIHSEELFTTWLHELGEDVLPSSAVTGFYSELKPCDLQGHWCSRAIAQFLPQYRQGGNLSVSWSHEWVKGGSNSHIRTRDVLSALETFKP